MGVEERGKERMGVVLTAVEVREAGARVEVATVVDAKAEVSRAVETKEARVAEVEEIVAHCLACAVAQSVVAQREVGRWEAGLLEAGQMVVAAGAAAASVEVAGVVAGLAVSRVAQEAAVGS